MMVCEIHAGDFSDNHKLAESYDFPGCLSVFQADVLAILRACRSLGDDIVPKLNIVRLTDKPHYRSDFPQAGGTMQG